MTSSVLIKCHIRSYAYEQLTSFGIKHCANACSSDWHLNDHVAPNIRISVPIPMMVILPILVSYDSYLHCAKNLRHTQAASWLVVAKKVSSSWSSCVCCQKSHKTVDFWAKKIFRMQMLMRCKRYLSSFYHRGLGLK